MTGDGSEKNGAEEELSLDERQTRRQLIDEDLQRAGWDLRDRTQVIPELTVPDAGSFEVGYASDLSRWTDGLTDYALMLHGRPVAVLEAKRAARDPREGREQALQYAQGLQGRNQGRMPFVLYSNGYDHYFWDTDRYPPVKVYGFPSRRDLEWLDQRSRARRPLSVEMIDTAIVDRDYQIAAVRSVLEGIEESRTRFLLAMATGTGKTRTAIALSDLLVRAHWAKRVLFLVDRTALQEQALGDFKRFMPDAPRWPDGSDLLQDFSADRRVYVTTYQRMLNLIQAGEGDPAQWLSPFFFDLVIADESHRTIYDVYLQVLDYFHGFRLGLTATPKSHVDHNTFRLFDCDVGTPTYGFSFEDAIDHQPPYLSDFAVLKERSKFQLEGIRGRTLPASQRAQLRVAGHDPADIDFAGTDLERKVINSGTNVLIVREFMEECIKDPTGTLPGKSIIFAMSKDHARRLEAIFDRLYPQHRGRLARVMVSGDERVHGKGGLLDQFKSRDMPRVAISVDMLDTGVDVREVVNLVFAKPVYSYVKFWQMIGRGTRLLPDDSTERKSWCPQKDLFLIFDCWGSFDYFDMKPKGREPGAGAASLPERLFRARLDRLEAALAAQRPEVVEKVKRHLRQDLADLPEGNVVVRENRENLARTADESFWDDLSGQDLGYLRTVIAPVLRTRSGANAKELRFEVEVVEYGTALLAGDEELTGALALDLRTQIDELPLSVNVVAAERPLIEDASKDAWWAGAPQEMEDRLDRLAERLAPLMGYRRPPRQGMVTLHLDDEMMVKERIEFGPEHASLPIDEYRRRVEQYVRRLVDENPVLQRLRDGEHVSTGEVQELAELLRRQEPYVTEERLRQVYDHKTARFVQFLRHILGVEELEDREAAIQSAFDELIARHNTWGSLQIRFLRMLKVFLLQRGQVGRRDLIQPPFTQLHRQGVRGILVTRETDELLAVLDDMGERSHANGAIEA